MIDIQLKAARHIRFSREDERDYNDTISPYQRLIITDIWHQHCHQDKVKLLVKYLSNSRDRGGYFDSAGAMAEKDLPRQVLRQKRIPGLSCGGLLSNRIKFVQSCMMMPHSVGR